MARSDDEREFRLRPSKPHVMRNEGAAWSNAFKLVMHYARSSRKGSNRGAGGKGKARPYHQRCAVRVTYIKNKIRGQWKAHGRYVARESASDEKDAKVAGFSRGDEPIDIAKKLDSWQAANDQQLWKMIVSPEFGARVELRRLTRELIGQMEKDLGTELEWIAVEHHNTEHPHVHVVVRGVRDNGETLRFRREFVRSGIRNIAEDRCTRQLGYRTQLDAAEAEIREVAEKRFTSIDRRLLENAQESDSSVGNHYLTLIQNPAWKDEMPRLAMLQRKGLAVLTGANTWRLRRDFEQILRAMQKTADRQRTLAAHGALMSDERLHIEVLNLRQITSVEGRVLVHGQDEQTGRNYLMLEGTDAKIHFIEYTPEIERARSRGEVKTNAFVRLRKLSVGEREIFDVSDLSDAERMLNNPWQLGEKVQDLRKRGLVPTEDGWGGWLGRYQAALCKTLREVELDPLQTKERHRVLSRGR